MTTETGETVLVVENEAPMRRFLRTALATHGFRVAEAGTLREAEEAATRAMPVAIVLDLGLPDGDGLELLRRLREWSTTPVIVLSARDREDDKVTALDAGADDYLTKPFGTSELLARIRVALRHARTQPSDEPIIAIGPIRIDRARHEVAVDGALVHLTPIEFRLLALLAAHAGKVLTHRQLLLEVWGPGSTHETHYLRVHMAALRRKIERDAARPKWLATEAGVGYRLRDASRSSDDLPPR
ncbi:MAG TPA: response regulator [Kofleriaceae bacterium]|jgi:two-component system KDP operon response regulator KdpE